MSCFTRILSRTYAFFFHVPSPVTTPNKWQGRGLSDAIVPRAILSSTLAPASFCIQKNEGATMRKIQKIACVLLFGSLLVTSLGISAQGNSVEAGFQLCGNPSADPSILFAPDSKWDRAASSQSLRPILSSEAQGTEWVLKYVGQYPEILWLADAKVRKTEEGVATAQGAYSEQIFGQKFIEFDRTMMTLRCLHLILDGSEQAYQAFTAAQPAEMRLLRESFGKLHVQGMALLKSNHDGMSELEIMQAMEAALVLGDIGKSEVARGVFEPYGAKAPDHDDFHGEVMQILQQYPELCPTFDRLMPVAKKLLTQTANLAHYGHITHIEGGPAMFTQLKRSGIAESSSTALSFSLFIHMCDVAGALGHVNHHSSLVYTEPSYLGIQGTADACRVLTDPRKTAVDAYNAYLTIRANWLGLNAEDRTDRALTRMGAMLRLFTPEEGLLLKQAVLQLDLKTRTRMIAQLDLQDGKEFGRTPTYMPAVLVNLANNPQLGSSKEERLSQAVILGLPFLSRVLETQQQLLLHGQTDAAIPLNFNKAAGVAKTAPHRLMGTFTIDADGNVSIAER